MTYTPTVFGQIIDADQVEQALRTTLQTWIVPYLAEAERQLEFTPRTLPAPRSWPLVSEFDIRPHEQLPAIIIASPGTANEPEHDRGIYRATWRLEIAVAIADTTETAARRLASIYIAAIRAIVLQRLARDHELVDTAIWTGPDDHAVGVTDTGGQRAIYGTTFHIVVRSVVNARKGPAAPPDDPYEPPQGAQTFLTSEIVVLDEAP